MHSFVSLRSSVVSLVDIRVIRIALGVRGSVLLGGASSSALSCLEGFRSDPSALLLYSFSHKVIEKEATMEFRSTPTLVILMLVAVFVTLALSLSVGPASVWAGSSKNGQLHLTKECHEYTGLAGSFCTFTSSNLSEITAGSRVYYDQVPGIPAGLLDSNVVLDAFTGNRAVGRCTLDLTTFLGLCTFSDGTGDFTGFEARVDVDCRPHGSPCTWDGTYRFRPQPPR